MSEKSGSEVVRQAEDVAEHAQQYAWNLLATLPQPAAPQHARVSWRSQSVHVLIQLARLASLCVRPARR